MLIQAYAIRSWSYREALPVQYLIEYLITREHMEHSGITVLDIACCIHAGS